MPHAKNVYLTAVSFAMKTTRVGLLSLMVYFQLDARLLNRVGLTVQVSKVKL